MEPDSDTDQKYCPLLTKVTNGNMMTVKMELFIGGASMADINILKTDSRGRVTLPGDFRKEPLFEFIIEGD